MPMPPRRVLSGLLTWVFLTFAAAALGGIASAQARGFYQELARPAWAPPGWLFGPVWTLLYALMALAVWLVWRDRGLLGPKAPIALYLVQLALNAVWTWLFFVLHDGFLAFLDVVLLAAMVAATLIAFWRVRRTAGLLLLPYLAWTIFAGALTWSVWRMNPELLG